MTRLQVEIARFEKVQNQVQQKYKLKYKLKYKPGLYFGGILGECLVLYFKKEAKIIAHREAYGPKVPTMLC